jgi:hypothetical protein
MNTEEVKVMLCIDRIVWDALTSALDAYPEESLHDPASPRWTSRDVYAHFARWLNHSNGLIEAYCAGQKLPSPEGTPEEINSRWQQEDSRMGLNEAREKAQTAFIQRLRIIEAIPFNRWNEDLERIVRYDGAWHYASHINYIVATPKQSG